MTPAVIQEVSAGAFRERIHPEGRDGLAWWDYSDSRAWVVGEWGSWICHGDCCPDLAPSQVSPRGAASWGSVVPWCPSSSTKTPPIWVSYTGEKSIHIPLFNLGQWTISAQRKFRILEWLLVFHWEMIVPVEYEIMPGSCCAQWSHLGEAPCLGEILGYSDISPVRIGKRAV